jgi:DNA-binding MltR family transcriptional regulator
VRAVNELDPDVMDEVATGSPHATAIVAAAILEDHLTIVIKSRLLHKPIKKGKNPIQDMFRGGGPLGDFSNKIDLAYLLGCISAAAAAELHSIRRIRNAFAHQMLTSDFENDKVAALCTKLKIWEKCKITMRSADNGKVGHIVVQIGQPVKKEEDDVLDMLPHENVDTPRARYTAACQFYIAAFSLVIHDAKPIPKPVF